jgi:hypothetical protein
MHPTSATTSLCERRPGGVQETPDANEAVPDLLDDDISEELLLGSHTDITSLKPQVHNLNSTILGNTRHPEVGKWRAAMAAGS